EPEIDAKERACWIGGAERADDLLREPREKLLVREPRRERSVFAVEKNHVDVGAVVELAAAELTHPEDRETRRGSAELSPQLGGPALDDNPHANLREVRELERGLGDARPAREFAQRDPQHLALLPAAQRAEL